jgi:outer membrane protein assembly factor BamB
MLRTTSLAALLAGVWLSGRARGEDWPQFRGQNCSGISTSTALPTEFSFQDKVAWQAALGDGIGSPAVVAGRVYSTGLTGPAQFSVFCHDAATGQEQWRRDFETGELPRITPPNSHASSTPACDGQRVYVYFSTLGLLALNVEDGQTAWGMPLAVPAYLMDWGAGASPIVYGDSVIFLQDDDLTPYLLCVEAATGSPRWRTPRPDMLAGYATPVLCETDGRTDVVVAGTGKMKGYDPATGEERWTCNTLLRTIMTTPVVADGVIYIAVQSYGDSGRILKLALLEWLDTNQDARLTKDETPVEFHDKFAISDRNGDGALGDEELDTAFQHPDNMVGGGNIIQAIRGGGSGDVTDSHLLWNLTKPYPSSLSSPLVVGGKLLVVKAGGLSSCFDAAAGTPLWERKRLGSLGEYYASPVAADGKIYIASKNGFVVVLADEPALNVLARNDMGEEILATPAIADGRIYIRTREKLYCIAEPAP